MIWGKNNKALINNPIEKNISIKSTHMKEFLLD